MCVFQPSLNREAKRLAALKLWCLELSRTSFSLKTIRVSERTRIVTVRHTRKNTRTEHINLEPDSRRVQRPKEHGIGRADGGDMYFISAEGRIEFVLWRGVFIIWRYIFVFHFRLPWSTTTPLIDTLLIAAIISYRGLSCAYTQYRENHSTVDGRICRHLGDDSTTTVCGSFVGYAPALTRIATAVYLTQPHSEYRMADSCDTTDPSNAKNKNPRSMCGK